MFRFFRKNVAVIGWTIVGTFALTIFSGSVFFGFDAIKNRGNNNEVQTSSRQFMSLGNYDVDVRSFYQQYQGALNQYEQAGMEVSPIAHEQIIFQSMSVAINQQAILVAAIEENIEVEKQDIDMVEQDYLIQLDLKDRSELKKELKQQNVPYKEFRARLESEALIRKFQSSFDGNIVIDSFVVENSFKEFQVDYVFVNNPAFSEEQVNQQAERISQLLNEGRDVDLIKKDYQAIVSINVYSEPKYQAYLSFDKDIQDQLVAVDKNTYLKPFCKQSTCGIIKLIDTKTTSKPEDYDEATYAESLKTQLQQAALQKRISRVFDDHPINVYDPILKSVYYKNNGDISQSLNAYQELLSLNPSDPAPHFFRAELYVRQGKSNLALEELEKAVLKTQMLPDTDFAELHIFYGDLLLEKKHNKKGLLQYDHAFTLVQDNLEFLNLLRKRYEKHSFNVQVEKCDQRIAVLEKEKKEQEAKEKAELEKLLESANADVTQNATTSAVTPE